MTKTRTISFDEADAEFKLRELLPAYDEDSDVIVLQSGSYKASDLDLDEHSYAVAGNLNIEGDLSGTEEGGFLIVVGDLSVKNLLIGGPIVYVEGSLKAEHAIHTDYNHGELTVLGNVTAEIIAAEHIFNIGGTLTCGTTIEFGGLRIADPEFKPTLTHQQAARESSEFFVPEVLNSQGYVDGNSLSEYLATGENPVRKRPTQ